MWLSFKWLILGTPQTMPFSILFSIHQFSHSNHLNTDFQQIGSRKSRTVIIEWRKVKGEYSLGNLILSNLHWIRKLKINTFLIDETSTIVPDESLGVRAVRKSVRRRRFRNKINTRHTMERSKYGHSIYVFYTHYLLNIITRKWA